MEIDNDPKNAVGKNEIISDLRNFINQQRLQNKNLDNNNNFIYHRENDAKIKSNLTGIGSNEIEYNFVN